MTKSITSYKELLEEKARLKALMDLQKIQIREDWTAIKEDLKPSFLAAATVRKLFTRKASGVIANIAIGLLADGFVKKLLLGKANRIVQWVVPFFVKNYASHLAAAPDMFMQKLKHLFGKNGHMPQEAGMDAV